MFIGVSARVDTDDDLMCRKMLGGLDMNLDRVIAVRNSKTVYRDGDRCIKTFDTDYSKADVLSEALNQVLAEESGLSIPKIFEVTAIDGKLAVISEYIKGKPLSRLMEENPNKKEEYMNFFVDIHCDIHSKICPLLNRLKDKMKSRISEAELDADSRRELYTRLENTPDCNNLCHGDFNPSNIIVSECGIPYILDWSRAARGSVAVDAAVTYLLFRLDGDMDGAEQYLEMFCKKSDTEREDLLSLTTLAAAALSTEKHGKAREFLLSHAINADF